MSTVHEPAIPVLGKVELEPNREAILRLRFRFENRQFRFRTVDFQTVFSRVRPPEIGGFGSISWFSGGFSRFRHDFGSKILEPEPNHGSKSGGAGSI